MCSAGLCSRKRGGSTVAVAAPVVSSTCDGVSSGLDIKGKEGLGGFGALVATNKHQFTH